MERQQFIETWFCRRWRVSKNGALFQNIRGYNVAVMPDHNEPEYWKWSIRLLGHESGDWGDQKFDTEEQAKWAVLQALATRLGY